MGQARLARHAKAAAKKSFRTTPPRGLLDLPPELRNQIYEHVLTDPIEIAVKDCICLSSPLGRTCRSLRAEFEPMYKAHFWKVLKVFKCRVLNLNFSPIAGPLTKLASHIRRNSARYGADGVLPNVSLHVELAFDGSNSYQRTAGSICEATELLLAIDRLNKETTYEVTGRLPWCHGFEHWEHQMDAYFYSRGLAMFEWLRIARAILREMEGRAARMGRRKLRKPGNLLGA